VTGYNSAKGEGESGAWQEVIDRLNPSVFIAIIPLTGKILLTYTPVALERGKNK
jgi:hypothetical protein